MKIDKAKTGKILIVAGAAVGIYLLTQSGLGRDGSVESGAQKKASVYLGDAGGAGSGNNSQSQPLNSEEQTRAASQSESISPTDYLSAALGLTDFKLYPQSSGELKYSGIRDIGSSKKEIEGTLRTDLFGQMSLNKESGQLYQDLGGGLKLYTESSRDMLQPVSKKETTAPTPFTSKSEHTVVSGGVSRVYDTVTKKEIASSSNIGSTYTGMTKQVFTSKGWVSSLK